MKNKRLKFRRPAQPAATRLRHAAAALLLAAIMAPCAGFGQDAGGTSKTPEKEKKTTRPVRLLAVGEAPVFRGKLRNGVFREAEPAPGTLPPLEVAALTGEEEKVRTRLILGSISPPMRVPQSLRVLRLFKAGEERNDAAPWVRASLPEGAEPVLIVLWRDPAAGKWTKARSLVLPDGPAASPPRSVRILNITPNTVAVRFGGNGKSVALRPGRSVQRQPKTAKPLPVSIAMADTKGHWHRLYQGEASPAADERTRIFVFRSDGEEVRRPAKVAVITERIR